MNAQAHRAYHEYLLGRMADVLGINLGLELDLTRLSRDELRRAVTRCSQCPDPTGCEIWLDAHHIGAEEAPQLCRNKKMLEHLRQGF